ncbi:MAG: fluoride efflux transporter CrcB [Pseudomonadota bacterium]|nr:fluoride efflux transporter CrcB [Pseudomonadota bacterium]
MANLDRRELAAVFVGGATGAVLRVWLSRTYPAAGNSWPWVTFAINVSGAFLLGYLVTRLQERLPLSTYRRPMIGTGFCGALTTFSTMQLELLKLVDHHRYGLAAAYAGASLLAGYLAVFAATAFVRRIRVIA